jgi:hypothetical protein
VDFYVFIDLQIFDARMPAIRTLPTLVPPGRWTQIAFPPLRPVAPVGFAGLGHVSLLYDLYATLDS